MTDDLTTWLRAQLDEDRSALDYIASVSCHGVESEAEAEYFRFVDRAPSDIAAKRRILDEVVDEANSLDSLVDGEFGPRDAGTPHLGDVLLRLLALPYADRPGYREEWRVT